MYKLFVFVLFISLVSCNGSKQASDAITETNTVEKPEIYRFSVSFFSIGTGINVEAKKSYMAFLRSFEEENKVKISYETTQWGKEGEVDFCFTLDELDEKAQVSFVEQSMTKLKNAEHVRMMENKACRERR